MTLKAFEARYQQLIVDEACAVIRRLLTDNTGDALIDEDTPMEDIPRYTVPADKGNYSDVINAIFAKARLAGENLYLNGMILEFFPAFLKELDNGTQYESGKFRVFRWMYTELHGSKEVAELLSDFAVMFSMDR